MNEPPKYTFILMPGKKTRYIAGPYEHARGTPTYAIRVSIWKHLRDLVTCNEILVGSPENCQWGWDIHNEASAPAFITITKDGKLIEAPDPRTPPTRSEETKKHNKAAEGSGVPRTVRQSPHR